MEVNPSHFSFFRIEPKYKFQQQGNQQIYDGSNIIIEFEDEKAHYHKQMFIN